MDIHVLNKDLEFIGSFDDFEALFIIRRFHTSGEFELVLYANETYRDYFKMGNILVFGDKKAYIIDFFELTEPEETNEVMSWEVKGVSLENILSKRIIIPPEGKTHEKFSGTGEETIKKFIANSMVKPVNSGRIYPNFIVAENKDRGTKIEWKSRYGNLLSEVSDIAANCGLGIKVNVDMDNFNLIFDVETGQDLSIENDNVSNVIFSTDYDNILSFVYMESEIDYKNVAYVAGQGEGIERELVIVGTATGADRHEMFVDARDLSEKLEKRGEEKLAEVNNIQSFTCKINPDGSFKYEDDWNLGDIVTIQNNYLGIELNIRITEIQEIHSRDGMELTVTFGNKADNLLEKIGKIENNTDTVL